jgi:hypothetical protein
MAARDRVAPGRSTAYRVVTAVFGVLFSAIAVVVVVAAGLTVGAAICAAGLGILGVDALVSAYRSTPSLLSRIGPLP